MLTRNSLVPKLFLLTIVTIILLSTSYVIAEENLWPIIINEFSIEYRNGPKIAGDTLLAGKTYEINLEIKIENNVPADKKLQLYIKSDLIPEQGNVNVFSSVSTDMKTEIIPPNTLKVILKPGAKLSLKIVGSIPENYTITKASYDGGTVELHFTRHISIVTIIFEGKVLKDYIYNVIDDKIEQFNKLLQSKEDLIRNTANPDPTWATMVNSLIKISKDLASKGFVDTAVSILKTIPDKPIIQKTPSPVNQMLPWIVTGVLAVIAGIMFVMQRKTASKYDNLSRVVSRTIIDLETVASKLEKVDKRLSKELNEALENIKKAVG